MTTREPDQVPKGTEDPRLTALDDRLRDARRTEAERTAEPEVPLGMAGKGAAQGQRVISVLLGYPLGAGIVGWLIDGWLGTRPWVMLGLLFLGFAAGCREIFRISKERPE